MHGIKARRRTWMLTPAHREERVKTAQLSGADASLVDLEDSVPAMYKDNARRGAEMFFHSIQPKQCTLGIRINSPFTIEGIKDLVAISEYDSKPEVILVPKVESCRDIELVASLLDVGEYVPEIYALVETPRGIEKISEIARASRLDGVAFGAADYAAVIGCGVDWEPLIFARSAVVNAAYAAGIAAVDSPFFDLSDLDALRLESDRARKLGFSGKGVVHPSQIEVVDRAFSPTESEIAAARAIVETGRRSGNDISSIDGKMVGTPFFTAAANLVARVDGEIEESGVGGL